MKQYCIVVLFALFVTKPAVADSLRSCAVTAIDGPSVQVFRAGQARGAMVGDPVANADRIVTGPETRVVITCDDAMRVVLAGGTDIDVGTLNGASASESYAARMVRGLAGFILPLVGARRFQVRTPSAVASVRSTEWLVEVKEGATAVFVREGGVAVYSAGEDAVLEPGEGIDVTATGEAGPIKSWGQGRVDAMAARLGAGWR